MQAPRRLALAAELERFERLIHRLWQILAFGGVVTGIIYALTVSRSIGLGCAATSAVFLVWFVLIGRMYDSGEATRPFLIANTVVEAMVPWVFLLVLAFTKGTVYALSSWVPPFLYCTCITSYVPRLEPHRAAVFGAAGALVYPLLYFALLRPRLSPEALTLLINQPATQIARAVTLGVSGLIATLLIYGVRQLITSAGERQLDPLAKYGELRPIAQRALGAAFEGSLLERRVTVEQLRAELAYRPDVVGELMVRAEVLSRLTRPELVRVLDFGRGGGSYFVVSERLEGVTLLELEQRALAARQPLAPEIVAQIGLDILAALEALHATGLVLGELDRSRVTIGFEGAIALDAVGLPSSLRPAVDGAIRAPELALGEAPSAETDLFALGVVLWELLAGEQRQARHAAVSLSSRSAAIDPGWDALFLRVLAPDRALRPSAREMAEQIAPYASSGAREWLARFSLAQKRPRS